MLKKRELVIMSNTEFLRNPTVIQLRGRLGGSGYHSGLWNGLGNLSKKTTFLLSGPGEILISYVGPELLFPTRHLAIMGFHFLKSRNFFLFPFLVTHTK
jgi:hypothetical protein